MINLSKTLGPKPKVPKRDFYDKCLVCKGEGKITSPDCWGTEREYTCDRCNGSCKAAPETAEHNYKVQTYLIKKRRKRWEHAKKLLKQINNKLTKEELQILTSYKVVLR